MNAESIDDSAAAHPLLRLGRVLGDYLELKGQTTQRLAQRTRSVLGSWLATKKKVEEENRTTGLGFNPLSGIPIKEPVHSKIIGDFLNPNGSHGQKGHFLECFMEMLDIPERGTGTWQISIETGRVDILLWRESPAAMILIENKVKDAQDQPNQLYRYWHHQMYLWKPEHCRDEETRRSFRLIYLPADGSKAPAPHSLERPADWGDEINAHRTVPLKCETFSLLEVMNRWQDKVLSVVPDTNHRLRGFFHLYRELWTQP